MKQYVLRWQEAVLADNGDWVLDQPNTFGREVYVSFNDIGNGLHCPISRGLLEIEMQQALKNLWRDFIVDNQIVVNQGK